MSEVKFSSRPRTDAERRQVVTMVRAALADPATEARARDLLVELLQAPAEAWAAADAAARVADDEERVHAAAEAAADAAWDAALERFAWSLRGPEGRPATLNELVGASVRDAQQLSRLREVELTGELRSRLDASTLSHDPAAMAALEAAAATLDAALAARGRARAARIAANLVCSQSVEPLDRGAAAAGRALRILIGDPTARALLPVF